MIVDLLLSFSKPVKAYELARCWFETLSRFTSSLGAWSFDGFSPVYSEKKKGKETQIRGTSTILTNYVAQFTFFFFFAQKSYKSNPQISGVQGICRRISSNDHLYPTATFCGGQSIL